MKIALIAAEQAKAKTLYDRYLLALPDHVPPHQADIVIALGGDGFILHTLHNFPDKKIYGINCGTTGFLLNAPLDEPILERLEKSLETHLFPLKMTAECIDGRSFSTHAINEVAILRESRQAAKIAIYINDRLHLECVICDGIIVATPAGSTAYNLSAHGPILPLNSKLLALTPISCFRPRRWRGALIPQDAKIRLQVLEHEKRPVSLSADYQEIRDVIDASIEQNKDFCYRLLFDPEHNLEDRILKEQFLV